MVGSSPRSPQADDLHWRGAVDRALVPLHSAVAHDLRAPLNALGLNLALLRRTLEADPASARRWLGVVEEEAKRLEVLLGAQLALTTAAAPVEGTEVLDLGTVLREGEPLLRAQAERGGVSLELELSSARGRWPGSVVRRAVLSAVSLALEETPKEGTLRVVSAQEEGAVRLTLLGAAPSVEVLESLFDPLDAQLEEVEGGVSLRWSDGEGSR